MTNQYFFMMTEELCQDLLTCCKYDRIQFTTLQMEIFRKEIYPFLIQNIFNGETVYCGLISIKDNDSIFHNVMDNLCKLGALILCQ